jgi:hypothetical protein
MKQAGRGSTTTQHPFQYCTVCRLNHNHGYGHVYTKKHQAKLGILLDKALAKVNEMQKLVEKPLLLHEDKQEWCIICQKEIDLSDKSFVG